MTSEKVAQIRSAFQTARKNGDYSEINKYSLKDLNQARYDLIQDKDEPYYQLILDKISEMNKKEERSYDLIKGIILGILIGIVVSILSQYIPQFIFK